MEKAKIALSTKIPGPYYNDQVERFK